MDKLSLSLRQRKLLRAVQNNTDFITGKELARQLNVSPRTIRYDITEINRQLASYNAQIISERSKGYIFFAESSEQIHELNQIDAAFFTKEDRVRYLAFRLCLTEEPINLFDLEDEMYVSNTTIKHDLHLLKMKYVIAPPYIRLIQEQNELCFEQDEKKIRHILNQLYHENWNYNMSGKAYYGYHYLKTEIIDLIMEEIPFHLRKYRIKMEDSNLVSLTLAVAIMYHRILLEHPLPDSPPIPKPNTKAYRACWELLDTLEHDLKCAFPQTERDAIYKIVASGQLPNMQVLSAQDAQDQFGPITIDTANIYLQYLSDNLNIDLRRDEDFYTTLLLFIRYLQSPAYSYHIPDNINVSKETMLAEFAMARTFQDIAAEQLGFYINESELLYLAYCLAGGMEFLYHNHPETKIKTVICGDLNLPATWSLNRKILNAFSNHLDIVAIMPINAKRVYDFSDIDLVLTTVKKQITDNPMSTTIQVSPFFSAADYQSINSYINEKKVLLMCNSPSDTWKFLIQNALWHNGQKFDDKFSAIEYLCSDLIDKNIVDESFLTDILKNESISSFATRPGLVFLYSLLPAKSTRAAVLNLKHRITWNTYKIRTIIIATFRSEDTPLVFLLNSVFYSPNNVVKIPKEIKNPDELINLLSRYTDIK